MEKAYKPDDQYVITDIDHENETCELTNIQTDDKIILSFKEAEELINKMFTH